MASAGFEIFVSLFLRGLRLRRARGREFVLTCVFLTAFAIASPQTKSSVAQAAVRSGNSAAAPESPSASETADLEKATGLTSSGHFSEAIPLLEAAEAQGIAGYAGRFNLALCYVATGEFQRGIAQLLAMRRSGQETAAVDNLLAQAYIGRHAPQAAWGAIRSATFLAPKDEHLYAFLLDACADHYEYDLGLRIATLGLAYLPQSQRLHYERAVFLARLDRLDEAKPEFAQAIALGPDTDLGTLAQVQQMLYEDNLPGALTAAHTAVAAGHRSYEMLSLLGTVLLYTGAVPGQPDFLEARQALESSVAQQPDFSTAQIALGKVYLMEGRPKDAVTHLEVGRRLEPQNPAVYTSLAAAYRRLGDKPDAELCVQALARLLHEKSSSTAEVDGHP